MNLGAGQPASLPYGVEPPSWYSNQYPYHSVQFSSPPQQWDRPFFSPGYHPPPPSYHPPPPPFSSAPPRPPDPDDLRRLQIEREERLRVEREETDAFCRNLRQNTAAFKAEMAAFKSEMLTEFRKLLRYSTQSRQQPSSPPLATADPYPYRCQQHQQPPLPPPTLPAPQQQPHQGAWYSNPQGYCQPPPPPPNPHPLQPQTPSTMIINGHPLPHQFPGVSQTHSPPHHQYFASLPQQPLYQHPPSTIIGQSTVPHSPLPHFSTVQTLVESPSPTHMSGIDANFINGNGENFEERMDVSIADGREFNELESVTPTASLVSIKKGIDKDVQAWEDELDNKSGSIQSGGDAIAVSTIDPLEDALELEGLSAKQYDQGWNLFGKRIECNTVESGKEILESELEYDQNHPTPNFNVGLGGLAGISDQRNFGQSYVAQGPAALHQSVPATSQIGDLPVKHHVAIGRGEIAASVQYGIASVQVMPCNEVTGCKSHLSTMELATSTVKNDSLVSKIVTNGVLCTRFKHYIEGSKKSTHCVLHLCFSVFDKKVRDKGSGHSSLTYGRFVLDKELNGNMRLRLICISNLISALENSETETMFDDTVWENLDVVINALDNVNARLYIGQRCLYSQKPQLVIPRMTENYRTSRDPPVKLAYMCTVHSFPHNIDHCLAWARSEFEDLLKKVPAEVNGYLTNPTVDTIARKNVGVCKELNDSVVMVPLFSNVVLADSNDLRPITYVMVTNASEVIRMTIANSSVFDSCSRPNDQGAKVSGGLDNLLVVIPSGSSVLMLTKDIYSDVWMDLVELKHVQSGLRTAVIFGMDKSTAIMDAAALFSCFYKHKSIDGDFFIDEYSLKWYSMPQLSRIAQLICRYENVISTSQTYRSRNKSVAGFLLLNLSVMLQCFSKIIMHNEIISATLLSVLVINWRRGQGNRIFLAIAALKLCPHYVSSVQYTFIRDKREREENLLAMFGSSLERECSGCMKNGELDQYENLLMIAHPPNVQLFLLSYLLQWSIIFYLLLKSERQQICDHLANAHFVDDKSLLDKRMQLHEKTTMNIDKVQAKESFDEWLQRNCKENCMTNAKLYIISHTGVINADGKIPQLNEYGVRNSHEPFNDELANHCSHARPSSTPLRYCSSSVVSIFVTLLTMAQVICVTSLGVMRNIEKAQGAELVKIAKKENEQTWAEENETCAAHAIIPMSCSYWYGGSTSLCRLLGMELSVLFLQFLLHLNCGYWRSLCVLRLLSLKVKLVDKFLLKGEELL